MGFLYFHFHSSFSYHHIVRIFRAFFFVFPFSLFYPSLRSRRNLPSQDLFNLPSHIGNFPPPFPRRGSRSAHPREGRRGRPGLSGQARPSVAAGTRPCWVTRAYPRDGASSGIFRTRSRAAKPGRRTYKEGADRSGGDRSAVPSRRGFPRLAPAPRKLVGARTARGGGPGLGGKPPAVAGTRPRRVIPIRPRASGFSRSRSRSSGVGRSTHEGGVAGWSGWLLLRLPAPFWVSRRWAFPLLPLISAARWPPG